MFMCVVNLKSVNKLDLTCKQSFLIVLTFCKSGHFKEPRKKLCVIIGTTKLTKE